MKPVIHDAMRPSRGWESWFAKLESCRSLTDGWNGYSAAAPAAAAIENAEAFLNSLPGPRRVRGRAAAAIENADAFLKAMQQAGCEPTRVAPSAMGGVAITRRNDRRKVLVEFYNDGRVFALFSAQVSDMDVKQIPVDTAAFVAFVCEIEEYLNG